MQVPDDTAPEAAAISPARIKELAALLHTLASNDNPGATVTTLQEEPFKNVHGGVRSESALAAAALTLPPLLQLPGCWCAAAGALLLVRC